MLFVLDDAAFVVAAAVAGALLHVDELGRIAHVARPAAGPIHVRTLAALPILGAEQAARLVGRRFADFGAQLFAGGRIQDALFATAIARGASRKVHVLTSVDVGNKRQSITRSRLGSSHV